MKIIESYIVAVNSIFRDSSRGRVNIKVFKKVHKLESGKYFIEDTNSSNHLELEEITETEFKELSNNFDSDQKELLF